MYNDLLVGSTGFVGGNLMASHKFVSVCHSTDIKKYYGTSPNLCLYAGVPAAMFLANQKPGADLEMVKAARRNLREINPKQVVLISTIAVYSDSRGKDENSRMTEHQLSAYGRNRLLLETWVQEDFERALILRLPALYGKGLKKNFLFDLHHLVPIMLKPDKYREICRENPKAGHMYEEQDTGFYHLTASADKTFLRRFFEDYSFSALSFTDSRSRFQFYNLSRLWSDINKALEAGISLLNLCTPPVSAGEIYHRVTGKSDWDNQPNSNPFDYDLHSCHSRVLGGEDFYLCDKETELTDIEKFMRKWSI